MRANQSPAADTASGHFLGRRRRRNPIPHVGCDFCHVSSITYGADRLARSRGGFHRGPILWATRSIHPYSELLLHNVAPVTAIVQTGRPGNRSKMRTPPLGASRTRNGGLLHDGRSFHFYDTIQRHRGEAQPVTNNFNNLSTTQQNQLITFLRSL